MTQTAAPKIKENFGVLHVIVVPDCNSWFAQGLEVDYGAQGSSPMEAKQHFQIGLSSTIQLNMSRLGNIDGILRPAPKKHWDELLENTDKIIGQSTEKLGSQFTQDIFPYESIRYFEVNLPNTD